MGMAPGKPFCIDSLGGVMVPRPIHCFVFGLLLGSAFLVAAWAGPETLTRDKLNRGKLDRGKLDRIEGQINAYRPDPAFKDDMYGLHVLRAALTAARKGSGGIGACLVDTASGQVVETGRNRQYDGYFRSDRHAEMDLLNRYEDRMKKKKTPGKDPRDCKNLVLVTSIEPCPMCMTRIINAGIKTTLYLEADAEGGMVSRRSSLPPFWQDFAADREFRQADCSPELRQIAADLFHLSSRSFARNRK